ncbi:MAG: 50S ribosomal protein L25 [bacterium]
MAEISLIAKRREKSTKGALNQLRKSSNIPGVYYSLAKEPVAIYTHEHSLRPLVYTAETHLVNLLIENEEPIQCILKDIQFDPITDRIIHFDVLGISADHELTVEAPVLLKGSAIGVKHGGMVELHLHKLSISCLPINLPEHIEIDISHLELNQSINVEHLKLDNIKILHAPEVQIVSVNIPRAPQTEETALTGEEKAEPEVIGKKKAEEED